jgi:hypothetical protein
MAIGFQKQRLEKFLSSRIQRENYSWPEGRKKLDHPGLLNTNYVKSPCVQCRAEDDQSVRITYRSPTYVTMFELHFFSQSSPAHGNFEISPPAQIK